jgi:hypothetical protein
VVHVVEAAGAIRIQTPLGSPVATGPDCVDGLLATSAGAKAVTVWLEDGLPGGLKDHLHQGWFGSVHHRGDTQWPQRGFPGFGDPAPTDRGCFVREVHGLDHLEAFCGGELCHPIDTRRFLAGVSLSDPSDREGLGGA